MQIVDSSKQIKTLYITPETVDISDIGAIRFINVNDGSFADYTGTATDLNYCYQLDVNDENSFLIEGETYVLEIYSTTGARLAYRSILKNISSSSVSEEYSNQFETL